MTEPILVVDIGTSRSAAAIVADKRTALLRDPQTGRNAWPSSVCAEDTGYLVGTAAERRKRAAPRVYIDGPRRAVDAQAGMWLGEREISGQEALTAYLSALAAEARRVYGSPIPRLVLTVPAHYATPDPRRDTMLAVGAAAGFADVELITDTAAVSLDPQTGADLPDGALALVCDLGATWTVALIRVHGVRPEQLAQETFPAGRDLDGVLVNDLRTEGRAWLEPLLNSPGDAGLRAYHEAIDFVRRLKHRLSDDEQVSDHLTPVSPPYRLTRQWLEAFAAPAVRSLAAGCHAVVAAAGAGLADLAAVIVAGGGARMPITATALADALGHPLRRSAEPEFAAVRGAARWAEGNTERTVPADPPPWRIGPVAWQVPGGCARLLHWTVADGEDFRAGAVLARVRTAEELVYELTAPQAGRLLGGRVAPGELVGPVLAMPVARDTGTLATDPPTLVHRHDTAGSWLLTPDRQTLIECDPSAGVVRSYAVGDGAVRSEFRPDPDGMPSGWQGRLFLDPAGRPALVTWASDAGVTVWDIGSGKPAIRLPDTAEVLGVLVNERAWRLAVAGASRVPVGRYRRGSVTLWDLRTGQRLAKLTEDSWQQRHPGYRERSLDGFAAEALSPDGQLRASTDGATVLLHDAATGLELFRVAGPDGTSARVAFGGHRGLLLAGWDSRERGIVDVFDV